MPGPPVRLERTDLLRRDEVVSLRDSGNREDALGRTMLFAITNQIVCSGKISTSTPGLKRT